MATPGSLPGLGNRTKTPELSVASSVFHCSRRTKSSYVAPSYQNSPRPPLLSRRQPSAPPSLTMSKFPGPAWRQPVRSVPFQIRVKPSSGPAGAGHGSGGGTHGSAFCTRNQSKFARRSVSLEKYVRPTFSGPVPATWNGAPTAVHVVPSSERSGCTVPSAWATIRM